jgi:hypothetical protein
MLREPHPKELRARFAVIDEMAGRIEQGSLKNWGLHGKSPALTALATGFKQAAGEGKTPQDAASAALQALAGLGLAGLPPRPTAPSDGTPVTAIFAMMEQACAQPIPARPAKGYPQEPVDKTIARGLLAIEFAHSRDEADARAAATLSMTERDAAMASVIEIEPPAMTEEEFVAALTRLLAYLRSFKQPALSEAAE